MQAHVQAAVDSDIHFARSLSSMAYGESSVPMSCTSRFLSVDDDDDASVSGSGHSPNAESHTRHEEEEAAANRDNPTRTAISLTKPVYDSERGVFTTVVRFTREMPFMDGLARGLGLTGALPHMRVSASGGGGTSGVSGGAVGGGVAAGAGGVGTSTTVLGTLLRAAHVSASHASAVDGSAAQAPLLVGTVYLEAAFGPNYPLECCQWRLLSMTESHRFLATASSDPHITAEGSPGSSEGDGAAGSGFTVSLGISAEAVGEYVSHATALSFATAPAATRDAAGATHTRVGGFAGGEAAQPSSASPSSSPSESPLVPKRERLYVLVQPTVATTLVHWLPHANTSCQATRSKSSRRTASGDVDGDPAQATDALDETAETEDADAAWPTSFLRDFVALVRGWVSLELDEASLHLASFPTSQTAAEHALGESREVGRHSHVASPVPEHARAGGGGVVGVSPGIVVTTSSPAKPGQVPTVPLSPHLLTSAAVGSAPTAAGPAVGTSDYSVSSSNVHPSSTTMANNIHSASAAIDTPTAGVEPASVSVAEQDGTHADAEAATQAALERAMVRRRRQRFSARLLPQGGLVAWGITYGAKPPNTPPVNENSHKGPPLGLPPAVSGVSMTTACSSQRHSLSHSSPISSMVDDNDWHASAQQPHTQDDSYVVPQSPSPPPPRLAYPQWVYAFYLHASRPWPGEDTVVEQGTSSYSNKPTTTTATTSSASSPQTTSSLPQQLSYKRPTAQPPSGTESGWPWPHWLNSVEALPGEMTSWSFTPSHAYPTGDQRFMNDGEGLTETGPGLEAGESESIPHTAKLLLTSRFYTDSGLLPTMLREPAFVFGTHRRSCRWADVNLTVEGEAHLAMHAAAKLCRALHLDSVAHLLSTLRRLAKAVSTTFYALNMSVSRKHRHRQTRSADGGAGVGDDVRDRDGEALNSYVHEMIGPVLRETVNVLQAAHQPFWAGVAVCGMMLPCLLRDGSRSDRDGASSAAAYSHAFGLGNVGAVEDIDLLSPFLHHAGIFGNYVSVVSLVERVMALVGQDTKRCEARIVRRALERALYAKVRPRATATFASTDTSVDLYLRLQRMKNCYTFPMTARHAPMHACAVCGLSLLDRSNTTGFDVDGASPHRAGVSQGRANPGAAAVVVGVRSGTQHGEDSAPEGCLVLQCMRCGHGGHVEHLMAWWADRDVRGCPKGCDCECIY